MKKLLLLFLLPNLVYGAFPIENEVIETITLASPETSDIWAIISSITSLLAVGSLILLFLSFDGENDEMTFNFLIATSILGLFSFISGIYSLIKSKKRWQTIVPASIGILLSIIPALTAISLLASYLT